MSFPAQVFLVLIASPSDVTIERDIAVRTIQEWNDLNSAERQLVLLPLRWETHSAPEYGKRPQEVINRQVVDHCDLLVGVFWTRVGSPTGAADSGTIEEIERVAVKGKPVMLYFSQSKQDPDKLDLDQLAKLREFKKKTFPKALIENYADPVEFKDKLSKQLEIQLRSLLAERTEDELGSGDVAPVTDIVLHFADQKTGSDDGPAKTVESRFFEIPDFEGIPDYVPAPVEKKDGEGELQDAKGEGLGISLQDLNINKDYYRQAATAAVLQGFFSPLRFWLKNKGGVGARDVYIDLTFEAKNADLTLIPQDRFPKSHPGRQGTVFGVYERYPMRPSELIVEGKKVWNTFIEVRAIQPQRELNPAAEYLIGASESCEVLVSARIYADTLPEPSIQELKLEINVKRFQLASSQIVSALDILAPWTENIGNIGKAAAAGQPVAPGPEVN